MHLLMMPRGNNPIKPLFYVVKNCKNEDITLDPADHGVPLTRAVPLFIFTIGSGAVSPWGRSGAEISKIDF